MNSFVLVRVAPPVGSMSPFIGDAELTPRVRHPLGRCSPGPRPVINSLLLLNVVHTSMVI